MQKPVKRFLSGMTATVLAFSCFIAKSVPSTSYAFDADYKNWSQIDSRWSDKTLGNGYATVGQYGCLATSIAILAVQSGTVTSDSFNPGTFVDTMNGLGGFDYGGSLVSWDLVSEAVPGLECVGKKVISSGTTKSDYINTIKELDDQGYYMICFVGNHWVLVDEIENNTIYMCDPGSSQTDMLATYPYDSYTHDTIRIFKSTATPPENNDNNNNNNNDNNNIIGTYEITASALNIRKEPSTSSESLGLIPKGENVEVTEFSSNGWGKVSYNGSVGWIFMDYAKLIAESTTDTTATTTTTITTTTTTENFDITSEYSEYVVVSETSDIKSSLEENADIIYTIPQNAVVQVKDIKDDYAEIIFDDFSAFISLNDIAPAENDDDKNIIPLKGDINGDKVIDKFDISILNEYILKEENLPNRISFFTSKGRYSADCNSDGIVDNDDVIQLLILICNQ